MRLRFNTIIVSLKDKNDVSYTVMYFIRIPLERERCKRLERLVFSTRQ